MNQLTKQAVSATLHCLAGCAIGEILGMVIGTALNLHDVAMIILSIALAFLFGYALSMWSLRKANLGLKKTVRTALASDTMSITTMEIVDNLIVVLIPGALAAGLTTGLFWGSLIVSLVIAFIVTVPVNRWLISRGLGHVKAHEYMHGAHHEHDHAEHHH